ncbi:MAG TPA: cytochrome c oxidase assembly protein [Vitreimonas sp.]|jgi:cytochrome c oxidase assembly protein subunit 11|nr:cytochrome c oxidase assembly protein [Vitreimonas sp.]
MSAPDKKRMRLTVLVVVGALLGMTGLAAAAVPLYRAFCQATGYGGTTQRANAAAQQILAQQVAVRFDTNVAPDMPITFTARQASETLHIGQSGVAIFHVRNNSDAPVTAHANFNVTPAAAGKYFRKIQCFCFQDRVFAPGQEADLPVIYFVDPEFADDPETKGLDTITLSYIYLRAAPGSVPAG